MGCRAEIATRAGLSKATVWRLANSANADHMAETVAKIGELHDRVVGDGEPRMFHATPAR